jgi:hypothetical protein
VRFDAVITTLNWMVPASRDFPEASVSREHSALSSCGCDYNIRHT